MAAPPLLPNLGAALEPILLHAEAGDLEALQAMPEAELPKKLKVKDEDCRTALHRACSAGHREVAAFLISKGADVDHADEAGWTPLHSCASTGRAEIVELLLEGRADANAAVSSGATPLHFAASKGHADVLRLLLAHGAKRGPKNRAGATPLLLAAAAGRPCRCLSPAGRGVRRREHPRQSRGQHPAR
ncbi:unnamed protein product, partial [Prorocentrum cordatum]